MFKFCKPAQFIFSQLYAILRESKQFQCCSRINDYPTFAFMAEAIRKVLVAPLDWGLGHATRCIPVIQELLNQKAQVFIAANGSGKMILMKAFPDCGFVDIPGIKIQYPADGKMAVAMLRQLPGIYRAVSNEHKILRQKINELHLTHVISDNRFGFYSSKIPCAYISHQLHIKAGNGLTFMEPLLACINHRYINRYSELWIPDNKTGTRISGELSLTTKVKVPYYELGLLSRFNGPASAPIKKYDRIALLSGPEPQRSLLEKKLIDSFSKQSGPSLIIRGLPGNPTSEINTAVEMKNTISDTELSFLLHPDTTLVCRPGYSTVMDLARLKHKKILFIPTPGQTEQEYLAKHLFRICGIRYVNQNEEIPSDVNEGEKHIPDENSNAIRETIQRFLSR